MACIVSTVIASVNILQDFNAIHSDINTEMDSHLGGSPRCLLEFPGGFLPQPLWPSLSAPNWELMSQISNFQMEGIKKLLDIIIGVITDFVPAIEFPSIPGLPGFSFDNLFPIDWSALLQVAHLPTLKAALGDLLPNPIFGNNYSSPAQEIMDYVMAAINNYMTLIPKLIMDLIQSLIDLVTDLFDDAMLPIPDFEFPTLPELPTLADILAIIPSVDIPGLNSFKIPFPLIPDFGLNWPFPLSSTEIHGEFDFAQAMMSFPVGFAKAGIDMIKKYWDKLIDIVEDVLSLPPLLPGSIFIPFPILLGKEE